MRSGGFARWAATISLPLYLADQGTKWAVLRWIAPHESIEVIPGFFNLVRVYNTGAAFGMMKGANTFFIALSLAALAVIVAVSIRGGFREALSRWAAALLLAGVVGNLTDRLVHGAVMDFLDVILPIYGHWPAFNIADSCICAAAGLFVIAGFREKKVAEKTGS